MKSCDNIVALAQELGVHRRLLYKWRDQLEPMEESEGSLLHNSRVATLRKEVSQLKRVLADKVVEVDFLRGALHKVEARRQRRGSSGEKASTTRSALADGWRPKLVGTARFELATPCTPSKCATRLRHVPTGMDSAVSASALRQPENLQRRGSLRNFTPQRHPQYALW